MSNIICLLLGILFGIIITYIAYYVTLKEKDTIIDDYKKGINIHNYRELRLTFINQSTKDYVKQQLNSTKIRYSQEQKNNSHTMDDYLAGSYAALKGVENAITQLEKNSEDLIKK